MCVPAEAEQVAECEKSKMSHPKNRAHRCAPKAHTKPILFLTPVGIKTLFPIFENSLCGKELAGKTQTLNATNKDIYFMSKLFNCFFFQTVERRTPDEFFAWQFLA